MADMGRHGTKRLGSATVGAKLDEAMAAEIKRLLREGLAGKGEVARRFGVNPSAITALVQGKTWGHVE